MDAAIGTIKDHEAAVQAEHDRAKSRSPRREPRSRHEGSSHRHFVRAAGESTVGSPPLDGNGGLVALVAAAGAGFIAVHAFSEENRALQPLSVRPWYPCLSRLAAYLANVAGSNRRMTWHWGHIEPFARRPADANVQSGQLKASSLACEVGPLSEFDFGDREGPPLSLSSGCNSVLTFTKS